MREPVTTMTCSCAGAGAAGTVVAGGAGGGGDGCCCAAADVGAQRTANSDSAAVEESEFLNIDPRRTNKPPPVQNWLNA
jgi:hypothetical protein